MRIALLFLILAAWVPVLHAQAEPPADAVELRTFDEEAIAAYRADPAYAYEREVHREPSFWERFKAWLAELVERLFGSSAGRFVTNNLLYILMVAALVFAVYILSKGGLRRVFHGEPRSTGEVIATEEDIRVLDLPALIREAEEQRDWRRAIRLHYLLVLRKLVDEGALDWRAQYTDRDYMSQLKDHAIRERFAHAARVFQWVWYGHATVDAARYPELVRPFREFEPAA